MRNLNSKYKLHESEINDIIEKCKKYNIKNYEIDDDGFVIVYGNVVFEDNYLEEIPLKFKEVSGDFLISGSYIASLFGCPIIVGNSFCVSSTNIKNLKYAPVEIGKYFSCNCNKSLINIRHFPKHVGEDISFWRCSNLKSLYGCLKFLNDGFEIDECRSLNTLKYGPQKVLAYYSCKECKLKTLYGAPKYVGGAFYCSFNELTTLKYSPRYIGGDFYFHNNNITSFDYFPDYVGGDIHCGNNPVYNVWKLFEDKEYIDYFNQMKIISDDEKKINIKKMNMFLKFINKDTVNYVGGYKNI